MPEVAKTVQIAASIERVWLALTDPQAMAGWMGEGSVAELDLTVGGSYRVFGGETSGRFTRIESPISLEYTWRQAEWDKSWPDSIVRWNLAPAGAGTQVSLTHANFPNTKEREGHDEGWDMYWLEPMKEWLEE